MSASTVAFVFAILLKMSPYWRSFGEVGEELLLLHRVWDLLVEARWGDGQRSHALTSLKGTLCQFHTKFNHKPLLGSLIERDIVSFFKSKTKKLSSSLCPYIQWKPDYWVSQCLWEWWSCVPARFPWILKKGKISINILCMLNLLL